MQIVVNGTALEVDSPTLGALLDVLAHPRDRVAVELNGRLVRRVEHDRTPIHANDNVEIVTLVGGG